MTYKDTQLELANNLTKLLRHLNFSDIRIRSNTAFPDPEVHEIVMTELGYIPPLMAKKNGVIYYFEFIEDNPKDLNRIRQPLQKIIALGYKQWDTDFVLVTRYGNKDAVREWCQNYNLPVNEIWEM
ncbi:hypothetical protein SAMN05443144_10433 [Fodinibius roseus]|uniref:Uncharacterized protein n=1 Tax=Fodinibius roseus TaxID=1194090 RepID=A0A1M4X600_9BACT|nr:hypothetical protein [Fodinibius roseus]SHE88948.1 hypothetical protein SAMN05443144_10433 [Fodinibius roseus]